MEREETIRLVQSDTYQSAEATALNDAIDRYNVERTGQTEFYPAVFLLRDADDAVRGGIVAYVWGDWLHVSTLWVNEELRRQGWGTRLLGAAEAFARERGCRNVYLETFTFQAPEFYPRFGYERFGTLDDYPPGHAKIFYRKRLIPEPAVSMDPRRDGTD